MTDSTGTGKYEAAARAMPGPARRYRPRSRIPAKQSALAGAIEAGEAGPDRADPRRPGSEDPRGGAQERRHRSRRHPDRRRRRTATPPRPRRWQLVREGKAELLMKGSLHTDELLGAVVARETGLRTGRRISHVFIMDVPTYHKVLIVTDAAINIAPTLEDKVDICQNAIDLAIALGVEQPKVAILAAVETVTSKMPATHRRRRAVQDGRARADHGRPARRPAGLRQRHQQGGGADQGHHVRGRRRSRHPARARTSRPATSWPSS